MKNFTTRLQRDITTNHPIFLTNRSKLWVFVKVCKKSLGTDRLQKGDLGGSIESTISINGCRTRQTCGIFLSQIHFSKGVGIFTTPSKAELVTRLISRNKPSNRTNKASRFIAVVETLSHPLGYGKSHLLIAIKRLSQMFYKFLFTGSRLRITVFANNLAEAYKRLPLSQSKPVLIARLPVQGGIYA